MFNCSRRKTIFISHHFSKHLAPVNVGSVEAEEKRTTSLFVGWKVVPCPAQSRETYLGICGLDLLKTVFWMGQIFWLGSKIIILRDNVSSNNPLPGNNRCVRMGEFFIRPQQKRWTMVKWIRLMGRIEFKQLLKSRIFAHFVDHPCSRDVRKNNPFEGCLPQENLTYSGMTYHLDRRHVIS